MARPNLATMREMIANVYPGSSWKYKVYHVMPDNQVIAIYHKFLGDGTFDKAKRKKKIDRENEKHSGKQMTVWDWLREGEKS